MQHPVNATRSLAALLACVCALADHAEAQPAAAKFPAGKAVSMHVGTEPGEEE